MINAQNLTKRFGSKVAVDDVSFTVERGEVLGFLGPNGAGKSTTMRLITGFLAPDSGTIKIGDFDLDDNPIQAKAQIGYLPENAPSYGEMTVDGFLRFTASLHGLRGRAGSEAVDRAITTCFLEPVRFQTIETLSKGYTHRTCFAQAILHDPEVLVLDEPTDGLDPNQKHEMRSLIKRMSARKAIILSTHILEEVDACCSRVIVINNGRIVANGKPDELRSTAKTAGSVRLTVKEQAYKDVHDGLAAVDGVTKVTHVADRDGWCEVLCAAGDKGKRDGLSTRLIEACQRRGWAVGEVATDRGRLDDVFREITTSETGGQG